MGFPRKERTKKLLAKKQVRRSGDVMDSTSMAVLQYFRFWESDF